LSSVTHSRSLPWHDVIQRPSFEKHSPINALWAVHTVADVHVNGEGGTVDGANQAQVRVGPIGDVPTHHFDSELGAARLHRIENRAAVFNRCVEEFFRKIPRIGTIPDAGVVAAGNIDAAARANSLRQSAALRNIREVLGALRRIRVEYISRRRLPI
jgi:hypothetical protein